MKEITELKNKHSGEDIWLIASGPSMNFVDNSFFENKITVGINRVNNFFKCDYVVAKDSRGFGLIDSSNTIQIVPEHNCGDPLQQKNNISEGYFFTHSEKTHRIAVAYRPSLDEINRESDKIVVSYSTITSGLHICAYLGAKNIIICGHDCGALNGKSSVDGYYKDIKPVQRTDMQYRKWLKQIEGQTIAVRDKLKEQYKCNIYSLNPFINFNLEGSIYT